MNFRVSGGQTWLRSRLASGSDSACASPSSHGTQRLALRPTSLAIASGPLGHGTLLLYSQEASTATRQQEERPRMAEKVLTSDILCKQDCLSWCTAKLAGHTHSSV